MDKLCISCDPFHQEFIPLERVERLIRYSREILGPDSVILRWPDGPSLQKHFGQMNAEELLEYFTKSSRYFSPRAVGRGFETFPSILPLNPLEKLNDEPCLKKMVSAGHYHYDVDGNLLVGIGCTVLGNIKQNG